MEPILLLVLCLVISLLLIIVGNGIVHKFDSLTVAYIIGGIAILSVVLLMVFYNSHPECDALINHNNVTLQVLQEKCYQYIDI